MGRSGCTMNMVQVEVFLAVHTGHVFAESKYQASAEWKADGIRTDRNRFERRLGPMNRHGPFCRVTKEWEPCIAESGDFHWPERSECGREWNRSRRTFGFDERREWNDRSSGRTSHATSAIDTSFVFPKHSSVYFIPDAQMLTCLVKFVKGSMEFS